MNVVNAFRPIAPMKNGVTKPYILSCSGDEYVVKFLQNPDGDKVLINEFICANIAKMFDLPLADPALIKIDEQFIEDYGEEISNHVGKEIKPGIHFGTKLIKNVYPINTSQILKQTINTDIIPSLILFDHIINNSDRNSNMGNLLFDYDRKMLVVIDHSHVFDIGALWDEHQLKIRIGEKISPLDMTGRIYNKLVPYIDGHNPFSGVIYKIEYISCESLSNIMNKIPQTWNINNNEKVALVDYLSDRIERVDEILTSIKPFLPKWKGGSL